MNAICEYRCVGTYCFELVAAPAGADAPSHVAYAPIQEVVKRGYGVAIDLFTFAHRTASCEGIRRKAWPKGEATVESKRFATMAEARAFASA